MGLCDSTTGLKFGSGLQFQTQIGGGGLMVVPDWVLVGDGLPATLDIDFVGNQGWLNNSLQPVSTLVSSVAKLDADGLLIENGDSITYAQSPTVFTAAAGTYYIEVGALPAGTRQAFGGDAARNLVVRRANGGNWEPVVRNVGDGTDASNGDTPAKVATGYTGSAGAISSNGGTVGVTANFGQSVTAVTTMYLGSDAGNTAFIEGYLKRFAFWPVQLANATLQSLTA